MEYAVIIILLALLQYTYFSISVGISRNKYGVDAPATQGNDIFLRYFRVQQNTLEQLVVFIPATLAFSVYVSSVWVVLPGVIYLIGRQLYSYLYIKEPASRGKGFLLTFVANLILIVGSLIGIGLQLIA